MTTAVTREATLLARRTFIHWRAEPATVLVMLLFPVLVLLMMSALLGGAIAGGVGGYIDFAMPGVLALTMLFGLESTVLALTTDASSTLTERLRSLPIHASSVLLGRGMADLLASIVGLAVTAAAGLALGWRPAGDPLDLLIGAALLLWLRVGLLGFGIWLGIRIRGPELLPAVQILVWPVAMVSSVFVSTATMPTWLGVLADWNPLSATTTAVRDLVGPAGAVGSAGSTATFAAEHTIQLAVLWPAAMLAVFVPLAARAYRQLAK